MKAGEYRFDHPDTAGDVYARLVRGDVYTRTLVIPEGYNIFDVAQAVSAAGLSGGDDFVAAERKHTELMHAGIRMLRRSKDTYPRTRTSSVAMRRRCKC